MQPDHPEVPHAVWRGLLTALPASVAIWAAIILSCCSA